MTDTTYVTTLDDWILGEDAKEMRSRLEGQSEYDLIGNERIALTRIQGHPLFVHEFELEAPLPPPGTRGGYSRG